MTTPQTESQRERPLFTGCCPRFDPAQVQEGEVQWHDRLFVTEHVTSLFHIPLNMVSKVKHGSALVHAAGAEPSARPLFLGEEISAFRSNIYLEATKPVPGAEMMELSGTFLSKVFEGPFSESRKWMEEMEKIVSQRGERIERLFFGYTTCPKCAEAYGENYVVLYAKLAR